MVDHAHDAILKRKAVVGENVTLIEPIVADRPSGGVGGGDASEFAATKRLEIEGIGIIKNDGTLEFVGEFADVAGPWVGHESFASGGADGFPGDAMTFGELLKEHLGESHDVVAPVAERRDIDAEEVEPMIEIFAEFALGDRIGEVTIGGSDDADIDREFLAAADAADFMIFDGSQNFRLESEGKAGQLVEEKSSAVGCFEETDPGGAGVGKGATFMSKEFAFGEGFREGGAIDFDERLFGTRAVAMNPAGDGGFTGAGLTLDQNGSEVCFHSAIAGDDLLDLGLKVRQCGAEHEFIIAILFAAMFLDTEILAGATSAVDEDGEFAEFEGFREVFQGPHFEGVDGTSNAALSGHDNDTGVLWENAVAQEIGAIPIGKVHIDNGEIKTEIGDHLSCLGDGVDGGDIGAEALEVITDLFPEECIVFEDEHT
jgi:hypothetical protein